MTATLNVRRSTDTRLPLWLRLVALAVEQADGVELVAHFGPGELREALAGGGELQPASVTRAIRTAEAHGLLARGSSVRCLRLVPGSLTAVVG